MKKYGLLFLLLWPVLSLCQTKVSGIVVDIDDKPIAFANVVFKNSTEGTITNEDGRFYLESETNYSILSVSFVGYQSREIELKSRATYNMSVVLELGEQLDEVVVYVGKQPKKQPRC